MSPALAFRPLPRSWLTQPLLTPLRADHQHDRDLIDAALAVNDAPTIDEAFTVLAEAALSLLGCLRVSLVLWDDDLVEGTVRAIAGDAIWAVGARVPLVEPVRHVLQTGLATAGPSALIDLPVEIAVASAGDVTVLRVPLTSCLATFKASWATEVDDAELQDAAALLTTLTRLTSLAERAQRERERPKEDYLQAMLDTIPQPMTRLHPKTLRVINVNRAFLDLVGLERDDVLGQAPPFTWWADETASFTFSVGPIERLYRRADGVVIPVIVDRRVVLGADGEIVGRLGLVTDLSERRRLEQQLAQSGKLAAIGELAAGVAHEINNPLFAILGLTEFLLKESEPGSKAHTRLALIQETGLEIKEIVRALLDFARENADDRHVFPLEDVVHQTVELVERTNANKGVELVATCDAAGGALVCASSNQLKQILLNLVANARQAMPNGGTVTIDVHTDGDHVVADVADSGPGISPDLQARIFEPFFTTRRLTGGTGLGLSVSLGIAQAHGGSLTLDSPPGGGAIFSLRLPVVEAES
jgi:PAS domain S-box-containing protein